MSETLAPRPVLAIAGASNGSGKTTLVCRVGEAYPGRWQAVKVSTVYFDGNCPRPEEGDASDCACRKLRGGPWYIVESRDTIAEPETDTGQMVASGLEPVGWGLARPGAHEHLWPVLDERTLDARKPLMTEGSQIAGLLPSTAMLYLVNPIKRRRWKDDAWEMMARADLVVINPNAFDEYRPDHHDVAPLVERLTAEGISHVLHDCSLPASDWPEPLRAVIEGVLDGCPV